MNAQANCHCLRQGNLYFPAHLEMKKRRRGWLLLQSCWLQQQRPPDFVPYRLCQAVSDEQVSRGDDEEEMRERPLVGRAMCIHCWGKLAVRTVVEFTIIIKNREVCEIKCSS